MVKLTLKQRRAMRRAGRRRGARMARNFAGQRNRRNRAAGKGDASMLRGIKQGVGRSVTKPFGAITTTRYHPCHHDAFHFAHLPLPRAVGPYTVVRTTQYLAGGNPLEIFGPFFDRGAGKWSDVLGVSFKATNQNVGSAGNVAVNKFAAVGTSSWGGAQIVPSAFSIQVMNPQALQTTEGIIYIGRIRTALKLSEDLNDNVGSLCNNLISYNNPRLCAAAKLAFRGVQIDLVPFNMSELANFTPAASPSFTQYGANSPNPLGFAPAFVYNPNKIPLQFLVCAEWRVRFDPSNPAQATHQVHPPASESVWAQAQHAAEALGNGVVDIADRIANTGQAVYNAMGTMYGVARGARALRAAAGPLALL